MKKIILLLLILCGVNITYAQYKPVNQGSSLKFTIKNLGFDVDGSFGGLDGVINFDPDNADAANFDVTVDAATVNTDNNLRDEHLRGDSYFDVKNNPKIRLLSTKVTGKRGTYLLTGKLTIKGKTQAIAFSFTTAPYAGGYQFKGSFKIKRKDFGIGGTSTIADELDVNLDVFAKKG
ncbi:YceI family protein [Mucilaginibacter sp. OK283]|uniref:YceI family protein n=1 Tax=Mucilaginibacter sp. OK283 TaxID=1881049 RepID=UPI0008CEF981|nr:YceI family protein [Mucilaginibacter sp. OK283]SEO22933.1 Polyisoprenoid-binding protein YceI [Mucilaginibacter sp. OK283]